MVEIIPAPKLPFPKAAIVLLISKVFESFTFYGIRSILTLYLMYELEYDSGGATSIYHLFSMLSFSSCIIGAIISDGYWGKYRTIAILGTIYVAGPCILAIGSVPTVPNRNLITLFGLFFLATGSGMIKPCNQAIGGDQFVLPDQEDHLLLFFSLFAIIVQFGQSLGTLCAPVLKQSFQCYQQSQCYPLSFLVEAVAMCLCYLIFLAGSSLYVKNPPGGNVIGTFCGCIKYAVKSKMGCTSASQMRPPKHWIHYSLPKYGPAVVKDVQTVLNVIVLYTPLPMFWAQYELPGSRWTVQATQMDCSIGSFPITPELMLLFGPLLLMLTIPMFQYGLFPILEHVGLKKPLQKLGLGLLLVSLSVAISGALELLIASTYPGKVAASECQLAIWNGAADCSYALHLNGVRPDRQKSFQISPMGGHMTRMQSVQDDKVPFRLEPNGGQCGHSLTGTIRLRSQKSVNYFLTPNGTFVEYVQDGRQSRVKHAKLRILGGPTANVAEIQLIDSMSHKVTVYRTDQWIGEEIDLFPTAYNLLSNGTTIADIELTSGSLNTIVLMNDHVRLHQDVGDRIHVLWQLPQYVVAAIGAGIYSVVGLMFTYSQGPKNMKTVMQTVWLSTIAFGHIYDSIFVHIFRDQATEFFFIATIGLLNFGLFVCLARRYKRPDDADVEIDAYMGERHKYLHASYSLMSLRP